MRIIPKIDLSGFEHKVVERRIRLHNGIVEQDGTPGEEGGRQGGTKPAPTPAMIQQSARIDTEQLQGTWKLISGAVGGRSGGVEANPRWVIAGDKIVMELKDRWEGKFSLDPAASPKRINLMATSPDGTKAEEVRGVYEVRGDELCVCLSFGDEPRPEGLRSSPRTNEVSLALKRQRPQPATAAISSAAKSE